MNKNKVERSNLKKTSWSLDGKDINYTIDLKKIIYVVEEKRKRDNVDLIVREIRELLRSKNNLIDSINMINLLEDSIRDNDPYSLNDCNRALYVSAVVFYGACFVKGGRENRYPLGNKIDIEKILKNPIHTKIMLYRNKLISHLDEDHDVRIDTLLWELNGVNDTLLPRGPMLVGPKVMMEMGEYNIQWIHHINNIITEIDKVVERMKNEVNEFIGEVEII